MTDDNLSCDYAAWCLSSKTCPEPVMAMKQECLDLNIQHHIKEKSLKLVAESKTISGYEVTLKVFSISKNED
jgi:hypothetical protein